MRPQRIGPSGDGPQEEPVVAAGILIMTRSQPTQFLLMRHPTRWDLPKGHSEKGELPRQTAMREMEEETGLEGCQVELEPMFEFVTEYRVQYRENEPERLKRVHYFLGWIDQPRNIVCTEHDAGRWFDWEPPHSIQVQTIDPLLAQVAKYLDAKHR